MPGMTPTQKRNVAIIRICQIAALALLLGSLFVSWQYAVDVAFVFTLSCVVVGRVVLRHLAASGQLPEMYGDSGDSGDSRDWRWTAFEFVAIVTVTAIGVALIVRLA